MMAGEWVGRVFLDGAELDNVVEFNREGGWVVIILGFNGIDTVTKKIYGYVETIPRSAER